MADVSFGPDPYRYGEDAAFNDERREHLRAEHSGADIWVGDEIWRTDARRRRAAPKAADIVTAILVTGYMNFGGRPIFPASTLRDAANDIEAYAAARQLKVPHDAAELPLERPRVARRPHVQQFVREVLELVEDAHEQGVRAAAIVTALRREVPNLLRLTIGKYNQLGPEGIDAGRLCETIWRTSLTQRSDPEPPAESTDA